MRGRLFLWVLTMVCAAGNAQLPLAGQHLLSPEQFFIQKNQSVNPLLLDVRPEKEYDKSRIPGALSADSIKVLNAMADTLDKEQPIFLYCELTERSSTAADILIDKGFMNVYVLQGGFIAWKQDGYPLDKTKRKNTYLLKKKHRNNRQNRD